MPLTGVYKPRSFYFGGIGLLDLSVDLIAGLAVFVVSSVVAITVDAALRSSYRVPQVNLEQQRIRVGRKSIAFEEVVEARIADHGFTRSGEPELHVRGGTITLGMPVLSRGSASPFASHALMERILEASSIAVPTADYDPTGRFARYNFPSHITKASAIDVIRHPPRTKADLPISRN
jgi:hypothetical protein